MKKSECWYGIWPIKFIWRGPWNDPLLRYKGRVFNYYDTERFFWEIWKEEQENAVSFLDTENEKMASFETWMQENGERVKEHFDYMIELEKAGGTA